MGIGETAAAAVRLVIRVLCDAVACAVMLCPLAFLKAYYADEAHRAVGIVCCVPVIWTAAGINVVERILRVANATFWVPVLPLAISIALNIPVDMFHVLSEPLLRSIHGHGSATAKELFQLFARLLLLFLAMTPVSLILNCAHKAVKEVIPPVLNSSRATCYGASLASFITKLPNTFSAAVFFLIAHGLTSSIPILMLFKASTMRWEGILAMATWFYSAISTAVAIFHTRSMGQDLEETKATTARIVRINRASQAVIAIAAAFVISGERMTQNGIGAGLRYFVAYVLGCGTVLSLVDLTVFTFVQFLDAIPFNHDRDSAWCRKNWSAYATYNAIVTVMMVLAHTTKFTPLIAVLIAYMVVLAFVNAFPVYSPTFFWQFGYVVFAACLCLPSEITWTSKAAMVVLLTSLQLTFLRASYRNRDSNADAKPAPVGDGEDAAIDLFLNALRWPFRIAVWMLLLLSTATIVQESWLEDPRQGFAEITAFTDLFEEEPASGMRAGLASCSGVPSREGGSWAPDCYQLCDMRWGGGLDIMDLALAASMAYVNVTDEAPGSAVLALLNDKAFRGPGDGPGDWVLRKTNVFDEDWVSYADLYSASRNISIIAVRGSSSRLMDWLEDMSLFGEATVFYLISGMVPGLMFWPPEFFQTFLTWYTGIVSAFLDLTENGQFFTPVVAYAKASLKEQPRDVVFTGHSLGGAVAKIVGTLVNKRSVGISSPGVFGSRKKFRHDGQYLKSYDIRKLVTNVVSEGDYVPSVGKLGGAVHELYCGGGAQCHSIGLTICELYNKCPSGATGGQLVGSRRRIKCAPTED